MSRHTLLSVESTIGHSLSRECFLLLSTQDLILFRLEPHLTKRRLNDLANEYYYTNHLTVLRTSGRAVIPAWVTVKPSERVVSPGNQSERVVLHNREHCKAHFLKEPEKLLQEEVYADLSFVVVLRLQFLALLGKNHFSLGPGKTLHHPARLPIETPYGGLEALLRQLFH